MTRPEPMRKEFQRKSIVRKSFVRRNIRRRSRDEQWPTFVMGLDLGQERDPSALAIVERVLPDRPVTGPDGECISEFEFHLRHLHRFKLGTEYPDLVDEVVGLMSDPKLLDRTLLVVDATGVGAAVVGLLWKQGLRPVSIIITGGDGVTRTNKGWRVPKRDIVAVLQVLFQTRRLKISPHLQMGDDLFDELLNFTARINRHLTQTFSPLKSDQHDDLVIALALPCHFLERLVRRPGKVRVRTF